MLNQFKNFFLGAYRDKPLEEQKRMEALAAIITVVAFVCLALPIIIEVVTVRFVTGGISLIFFFCRLYCLRRERADSLTTRSARFSI